MTFDVDCSWEGSVEVYVYRRRTARDTHEYILWERCKEEPLRGEKTVFAIYQIMLGWKTYNCYYETVELPNPRPTQPNKKIG